MENINYEAIKILNLAEPTDRGDAYKILKSQGYQLNSKQFNNAIEGYEKTNNIKKLPKSPRAIYAETRKNALAEAHVLTTTQAKKLLQKVSKGQANQKEIYTAWQTWHLTKDGKYYDSKNDKPGLNYEDFKGLFQQHGKNKLGSAVLEEYIETGANIVINANAMDKGQAYSALKSISEERNNHAAREAIRSSSLFNKICAEVENITGNKLQQSNAANKRTQIARQAHKTTLAQLKKHANKLKIPDQLCWKVYELGKQGKFGKENPIKDLPIFKEYFKTKRLNQVKSVKQAQKKQAGFGISM